MALRELERLTEELKDLVALLKDETRTQARWVILARAQEIVQLIDNGHRTTGRKAG